MDINEIEANFLTTSQIVEDAGVSNATVHNWVKYHRFLNFSYLMGKPVVKRADYEQFKIDHPELLKRETAQAA